MCCAVCVLAPYGSILDFALMMETRQIWGSPVLVLQANNGGTSWHKHPIQLLKEELCHKTLSSSGALLRNLLII